MPRKRSPERDLAKEIYIKSKGKKELKEIAKALNVKIDMIYKWKSQDKWDKELQKKKRGAPKGNKNAAGAGAPKGNKNAETHGGYSAINLAELPQEDLEYIRELATNTKKNLQSELMILLAKEEDIRKRIDTLKKEKTEMYITSQSELFGLPSEEVLAKLEPGEVEKYINNLTPKLKTIVSESKFERERKLLKAFDKIHGRILKLLDTISRYEVDQKKLAVDVERYKLSVEKAKGAFEVDPFDGLDE